MREVYENIITRRSCRSYTDQEIRQDDLDMILKAGIYAPSAKNQQSWQFSVIRNKETIQLLAKLVAKILEREASFDFYDPKVLVLISNDKENPHGDLDVACALENMFLMAHALGIGSCWINQLKNICDVPEVRERLRSFGVPDHHVVWGIADLGYAASTESKQVDKKAEAIVYVD